MRIQVQIGMRLVIEDMVTKATTLKIAGYSTSNLICTIAIAKLVILIVVVLTILMCIRNGPPWFKWQILVNCFVVMLRLFGRIVFLKIQTIKIFSILTILIMMTITKTTIMTTNVW